jgi:hypothetical protein
LAKAVVLICSVPAVRRRPVRRCVTRTRIASGSQSKSAADYPFSKVMRTLRSVESKTSDAPIEVMCEAREEDSTGRRPEVVPPSQISGQGVSRYARRWIALGEHGIPRDSGDTIRNAAPWTKTGTGTGLAAIHRSGINRCYAKKSESSTGGHYLSRPEPISRQDADVPQAVGF